MSCTTVLENLGRKYCQLTHAFSCKIHLKYIAPNLLGVTDLMWGPIHQIILPTVE